MSTLTHESMTNHHGSRLWTRVVETLQTWRQRRQNRLTLTGLTERDLHDVGLSWSDVVYEAEKPFWRA